MITAAHRATFRVGLERCWRQKSRGQSREQRILYVDLVWKKKLELRIYRFLPANGLSSRGLEGEKKKTKQNWKTRVKGVWGKSTGWSEHLSVKIFGSHPNVHQKPPMEEILNSQIDTRIWPVDISQPSLMNWHTVLFEWSGLDLG